jgi:hypothetical protein
MSEVTPGWKLIAIVAEGGHVSLQGQSPWGCKWLSSSEPAITVAHPSYPSQRHQMRIYDLDSPRSVRFAAGEFSNGIWGFYVPEPIVSA